MWMTLHLHKPKTLQHMFWSYSWWLHSRFMNTFLFFFLNKITRIFKHQVKGRYRLNGFFGEHSIFEISNAKKDTIYSDPSYKSSMHCHKTISKFQHTFHFLSSLQTTIGYCSYPCVWWIQTASIVAIVDGRAEIIFGDTQPRYIRRGRVACCSGVGVVSFSQAGFGQDGQGKNVR